MSDYSELERRAQAATGIDDVSVAPDVLLELIAENKRLERLALNSVNAEYAGSTDLESICVERDQLRAEVAGLKTGYEAYERVNAELKAECEALRDERDARHPFKPSHEPAIGYSDGCMVCGQWGGHFGLPCPQTRVTADAAMGKGEQP